MSNKLEPQALFDYTSPGEYTVPFGEEKLFAAEVNQIIAKIKELTSVLYGTADGAVPAGVKFATSAKLDELYGILYGATTPTSIQAMIDSEVKELTDILYGTNVTPVYSIQDMINASIANITSVTNYVYNGTE